MPDQLGKYCPEHDPRGYHCFCDEDRDRAAQIHRPGGLSDAFGGYECICRAGSWTTKYGCTNAGAAYGAVDDGGGPEQTAG